MAMKVSLSFKENEKDMYDFLMSQLSASIYIKQLIKNDISKGVEQPKHPKTVKDILDF
jgi:hypothetical protein